MTIGAVETKVRHGAENQTAPILELAFYFT